MKNEELLKQQYLTANDLQKIIPKLFYHRALKLNIYMMLDMRCKKSYFVLKVKTKVVLIKIIKKKLGF